jgi:hypothetical protein
MKATIKGRSKLDAVAGPRGYAMFSKVRSMTFFEDCQGPRPGYSLVLELESESPAERYRLRVRFTGVKELEVRGFGSCPTQVTGLDVVDVSSDQLEGIRFRVDDYENGAIRFLCGTAEVEEVESLA